MAVNQPCFASVGCRSLAVLDAFGSGSRTMITRTFTVREGRGRNSRTIEVGSLTSAIWRN